jgi:hypothetical protein
VSGTALSGLIRFLETGVVPDGLFAPGAVGDISLPHWRIQAADADQIVAIRRTNHPDPGRVHVERVEETAHGFTVEFEERWDSAGERWYAREMIRADVTGDAITELSVYCTGDWDEATQRRHKEIVPVGRT